MSRLSLLSGKSPQELFMRILYSESRSQRSASKLIREAQKHLIAKIERRIKKFHDEREYFTQLVSQLKDNRLQQKRSVSEISRRSGIAVEVISRLENGVTTNPTLFTIQRYAKALGMKVEWKLTPLKKRNVKKQNVQGQRNETNARCKVT